MLHHAVDDEGPGTSRSGIRRHRDGHDKADLEAAAAELKARRLPEGIRHRRHPHRAAGQDQPGAAAGPDVSLTALALPAGVSGTQNPPL